MLSLYVSYEIYVYEIYVRFFLAGHQAHSFLFYVQEISFRGGKIRDAQRMCIDGEWSQGAERYSIRGCSLVYVFMVLNVFSAFSM